MRGQHARQPIFSPDGSSHRCVAIRSRFRRAYTAPGTTTALRSNACHSVRGRWVVVTSTVAVFRVASPGISGARHCWHVSRLPFHPCFLKRGEYALQPVSVRRGSSQRCFGVRPVFSRGRCRDAERLAVERLAGLDAGRGPGLPNCDRTSTIPPRLGWRVGTRMQTEGSVMPCLGHGPHDRRGMVIS